MKKKCENCGNFSVFHTKISGQYFPTTCGRCWINKTITGYQETCEKWEEKPVIKNEQEELLKAFDTVIIGLNVIKEKLTKK